MGDKENSAGADCSERDETFFLVVVSGVALGDDVRVFEGKDCCLETDIVLAKILLVLAFMPFKSHAAV